MKQLYFLLFMGLVYTLTGCRKSCGPSGEPNLRLRLVSQGPLPITAIRALDALPNAAAIKLPTVIASPVSGTVYEGTLPVNLTADKSRYELINASGRDTITVQYRRVFTYEDVDCGYIVNLTAPQLSNGQPVSNTDIVQTTRGSVRSVLFQPTLVRTLTIPSSAQDTGITAELVWP
ncbi:hypothetical protein [Fibrivirga algicola]|uniref:Lipoprotein n=1 Tax=Fibrivirga algicola TaxID=2950420 RepID=A0ABX0QPH0_9BACT|nr:hypothetical protein [Fibrivirga algicola]NID12044.1 hypothetical protein [Fibrivirga algicola]